MVDEDVIWFDVAVDDAEDAHAEVSEFQEAVVVDEDVIWFNVAVDDAGGVSLLDGAHYDTKAQYEFQKAQN